MQIKCDHCGAVIDHIIPETITGGEIEYSFFRCSACGGPYAVAVTDASLRADISEYTRRRQLIRVKPVTEGKVTYGKSIKAIAVVLYSEGVVANDRSCTFINSLSGDSLDISEGSIYNFGSSFSEKCSQACDVLEKLVHLTCLNSHSLRCHQSTYPGEYYGAAEPLVRCGESHLSGLTEPLHLLCY